MKFIYFLFIIQLEASCSNSVDRSTLQKITRLEHEVDSLKRLNSLPQHIEQVKSPSAVVTTIHKETPERKKESRGFDLDEIDDPNHPFQRVTIEDFHKKYKKNFSAVLEITLRNHYKSPLLSCEIEYNQIRKIMQVHIPPDTDGTVNFPLSDTEAEISDFPRVSRALFDNGFMYRPYKKHSFFGE